MQPSLSGQSLTSAPHCLSHLPPLRSIQSSHQLFAKIAIMLALCGQEHRGLESLICPISSPEHSLFSRWEVERYIFPLPLVSGAWDGHLILTQSPSEKHKNQDPEPWLSSHPLFAAPAGSPSSELLQPSLPSFPKQWPVPRPELSWFNMLFHCTRVTL